MDVVHFWKYFCLSWSPSVTFFFHRSSRMSVWKVFFFDKCLFLLVWDDEWKCQMLLCLWAVMVWKVEGGEEQRTTNDVLLSLHYIVIYFLHVLSCVNRPMTTKSTYYYYHHPPPPSSSTCANTETPASPPPVVLWPADGGLGEKTEEQQPDAGTECEGRRGRAPDLSEWGRPAREMYSLPLLYRNPSPYEYYSIEHLHDTRSAWWRWWWWWWCLARMLFALAELAGWTAEMLNNLRWTIALFSSPTPPTLAA